MRDPWSTNPYKIYPTPLHAYLDGRKEVVTINQIDNMVYAYESNKKYHSEILIEYEKKKCIVIPNGYDEEDFSNLDSKELFVQGDYHLGFSGTFYSHLNNPENLFRALAELKKRNIRICFHHIGNSVYSLKKLAAKYDVEDQIVIWGYNSHPDCLKILNSMDALVVILDPTLKNADKTAGGKLYEYLRFKKPILGLVPENGEAAAVIKDTNSGLICSELDANQIANTIIKLKSEKFTFTGIEKYSRKNQAQKLNDFIESIN